MIIDTKQPTIVPGVGPQMEATAAPQPIVPSEPHVRESLAQMVPPQAGMHEIKNAGQKSRLKRNITRAHIKHQSMPVAQTQPFGFFDGKWSANESRAEVTSHVSRSFFSAAHCPRCGKQKGAKAESSAANLED